MGFSLDLFFGKIDDSFICVICAQVLEIPVESTCEHIFCNQCIEDWLAIRSTCPVCRISMVRNLKPAARYFRNLLDKLERKCDYESSRCSSVLKLDNFADHINNHCVYNPNSKKTCDKGCNTIITRREYETESCFSHLSKALKKLEDKQVEQAKFPRWQLCYNMNISLSEPNILEYAQWNAPQE
ncbi:E3 ubiquitin-protein ligase NRDP1 [Pseudolycoriella hygida]|uniref:E3 ubiquitin-protein ligase NRDP1 n=1 Tax=Pseudolycoriella hygida TaxID=35572 RepID=A0A9Q0MI74_9DIPT|nr:E3 ubiquitin-protein ligase NRDP1 [Pseudolycoriella hygida]